MDGLLHMFIQYECHFYRTDRMKDLTKERRTSSVVLAAFDQYYTEMLLPW